MTDRPILFSAPMVKALLAGRKTQMRRILTPENTLFNGRPWTAWSKGATWNWRQAWIDPGPSPAGNTGPYLKLPYGGSDPDWKRTIHRIYPKNQIGDRLWVRETWCRDFANSGAFLYRATDQCEGLDDGDGFLIRNKDGSTKSPWSTAIHMPRRAARLTLIVTGIEVERLHDISEAAARAEGMIEDDGSEPDIWYCPGAHAERMGATAVEAYRYVWDAINGPGSWATNPWIIATTFTIVPRNIDATETKTTPEIPDSEPFRCAAAKPTAWAFTCPNCERTEEIEVSEDDYGAFVILPEHRYVRCEICAANLEILTPEQVL